MPLLYIRIKFMCKSLRGVKLTTYYLTVPRLIMYGAILPFPPYAAVTWC